MVIETELEALGQAVTHLNKRIDLCERIFGKIMQLDARLDTLEFNSNIPTNPSAAERLMDVEMRIERLESYLLNGEKK